MFCKHKNQSWPFTSFIANPLAGEIAMGKHGEREPDMIKSSYVRCTDCGFRQDYDVDTFTPISAWYHEPYVHTVSHHSQISGMLTVLPA